jgi:hypothetical protein
MKLRMIVAATALAGLSVTAYAQAPAGGAPGGAAAPPPDTSMSFFVTSVGKGDGANLGGIEGADAHCQALAEAAGTTGKTWHAYLSTSTEDAKDRIGSGPWYNANAQLVARSVDHLHYSNVLLNKANSVTEKKGTVNGVGDTPNEHDILTGSNPDGTKSENTCNNWTSNGEGAAVVGHLDRTGGGPMAESWNAAHNSRGCSQDQLKASGGNGYFYCFATGE